MGFTHEMSDIKLVVNITKLNYINASTIEVTMETLNVWLYLM